MKFPFGLALPDSTTRLRSISLTYQGFLAANKAKLQFVVVLSVLTQFLLDPFVCKPLFFCSTKVSLRLALQFLILLESWYYQVKKQVNSSCQA